MILRKPYAFLIKNFKKIHFFLLLLCSYVYYKATQLSGFLDDFIKYLSYDPYIEPISDYIGILLYIFIALIIIISLSLLILLKKKDKPWKLYVFPIITYFIMLFINISAQSYFGSYEGELITRNAKAIKDFIFIGNIFQYIVFVILFIRIIGLDLNKFSFSSDKEFLELEQDDKEEFEISVNVDSGAFKRNIKKWKRYTGYFYEEHKYIVNLFGIILGLILIIYIIYYFGISHRITTENNVLKANNYEITINKSFYTNKDKTGKRIEKDSSFVILNLTIKNNGGNRKLNSDNFHLKNGRNDYVFTNNTYSNDFIDLGQEYSNRKFRNGEVRTYAMIFKVDKNLNKDNFVLYYQEYKKKNKVYLRKISLKLDDVSKINKNASKNLGEKITIKYPNNKKMSFLLQNINIQDESDYNIEECNDNDCIIITKKQQTSEKYKILKMEFNSNDFEGEELIDFLTNYGKIKYVDNQNLTKEIKIENAIQENGYIGKVLYIKIPNEVELSKKIEFIYTIRNQKYFYKLR